MTDAAPARETPPANGKLRELLTQLRALPPRTVAAIGAAHVLLLAGIAWGELHYLMLQLLLAIELLVFNLASIIFYPQRGLRRHITDMLKMAGGMVFVLFFLMVTYGIVAAQGGKSYPLMAAVTAFRGISDTAVAWTAFYIALRMLVALWQARAAPEPRIAWMRSVLSENAVTFIAMFLMVFATFFIGLPIMLGLKLVGLDPSASLLLATVMVVLRFALTLVVATMPAKEMEAMAADPYID